MRISDWSADVCSADLRVAINTHVEKLERRRERAALKAANLENSIENELLERLKQASEGDIYNYPEREYSRALLKATEAYDDKEEEEEDEEERTVEYVEDLERPDEHTTELQSLMRISYAVFC